MFRKNCLVFPLLVWLLGTSLRLAWCVHSPRSLLDHAAKVAKLKNAPITCWLSDHTLIIVTSDKRSEMREGFYDPSQWKGKAHLLNTRTHRCTHLPGLTRMLQHWHWRPNQCELVAGGKWLLWWASDCPDSYPNTLISTRNGSWHQRWQYTKGDNGYWLNEHLWIDQDRFHNSYEPHPRLHIFDVNHPKQERSLRVDAPATRAWLNHQAHDPFVYDALIDANEIDPLPLRIGKYRVADYYLREQSQPIRTFRIMLPAHLQVERVEVSPDDKKVLIETTSPVSKQWKTLWTCRVDGSHLYSHGAINLRKDYYTLDAKWLPGSHKIGFEVDDCLYTVNVE